MREAAGITATRRAELILHEVESLPTLPSVATRLMKVGSSDDADLKEIIKLIETDPVLTAKILSMCRRADLGVASRVTTVERAVILLGLETVQSMVLGVQVFEWSSKVGAAKLTGGTTPDAGASNDPAVSTFDRIGYWRHSIAVACCAEMIAQKHREYRVQPGEAFVAGLLHDLGKLALEIILPQAYQRVIELSDHRQANIADVEKSVVGLDHHTAGKRLAERWELPVILRDAIWLHGQRPDALPEGPHKKLIGLVHVADCVCRNLHIGWSGNHTITEPLAEVCKRVGLDARKIEQGLPDLLQAVNTRCTDLGLTDEPSERMVLDALGAANRQLSRLSESSSRRAKSAQDHARVLDELGEFSARAAMARDSIETISAVASSAVRLLGTGRYVVVTESAGVEQDGAVPGPLMVHTFFEDGRRLGCDLVDPPFDLELGVAGPGVSLSGLRSIVAAREILDLPGASVLSMCPVTPTGGGARPGYQAGAALLHDRDEAVQRLGPKLIGIAGKIWGAAVQSAMREERAGRATEDLAGINQRLAHAEKQLAEAESLARLAELTAGAAHEFNNPLSIIAGRGQMLEQSASNAQHKSAASAVVNSARTLSDLVQRLHFIARPPEPVLEPTNLSELLQGAVDRATKRVTRKDGQKPAAAMSVSVAEGLGLALVDRELLTQALVEVIVNAIESEPSDFIVIRVQTDPVDDRLLIQVTDTGRGMSEHAVKHATDPFFSEKPAGRQPGLGLALSRRLVVLHQGTLAIDSTPGDGTIVTVALPEWREKKQAARIAA